MGPEAKLKLQVIDWLLDGNADSFNIGIELPVNGSRSLADLVLACESKIIAIEIKSSTDDLRRLAHQLQTFSCFFNGVYVAVPSSKTALVRQKTNQRIGLIEFTAQGPRVVRKTREKRLLAKRIAAKWLYRRELETILGCGPRNLSKSELEAIAVGKLSATTLHRMACASVTARVNERFETFLSERSEVLTEDDLKILRTESFVT